MFATLLEWIKKAVAAMFGQEQQPVKKTEIALGDKMRTAIELWSKMYQDKADWNIARNMHGLKLPAAVASELARQATIEAEYTLEGSPRAEYLTGQFAPVFDELRRATEYGCAKGGLIFKPYPDGQGGIAVDLVQADRFAPVAFDSRGNIIAAVFTETLTRGKNIFTRYEYHALDGSRYTIRNIAYASTQQGLQGHPVPLASVPEWAELAETVAFENIKAPLFGYFRAPGANTIDDASPLGVSVYSRAVTLIRQADEQWERILWEFEGGELAVDASEDIFRLDESGKYKLPKGKERLYRLHDVAVMDAHGKFIETFAPQLRDSSLFNGLNNILKRIEFNCGLAYGTLSDPQNVDKTAEEIKTSKQRSYATVTDIQKALETALRDLVYAMDVYASLYQLAPAGEYSLSFCWDDSVLVDSATQRMQDKEDVRDGIMQRWEYRMKWYGEDEETARRMADESGGIRFPEGG